MADDSRAQRNRNLLRWPAVQERVGLSRREVDRREQAGLFPKRIQIGARSVAWDSVEIDEYVERLAREAPRGLLPPPPHAVVAGSDNAA